MHGPEWAWPFLFGMMLGTLAVATAVLLYLMWRVWRHRDAWWRWPALIGITLGSVGLIISLWQFVTELLALL